MGLWSQPGLFSWDRIDPGSALLAHAMPPLAGRGADFGCGYGYLARAVLASPSVQHLSLIDLDRRAVSAARRNVADARVQFIWDDVRAARLDAGSLDFVVMNPPFHDAGAEDKALGHTFIKRAADVLRKGGSCWLTANRHLPYEAVLASHFASASLKADRGGYKVYEAKR
jgi:16S rRNA (guanine1207-N2)-methyltransferase